MHLIFYFIFASLLLNPDRTGRVRYKFWETFPTHLLKTKQDDVADCGIKLLLFFIEHSTESDILFWCINLWNSTAQHCFHEECRRYTRGLAVLFHKLKGQSTCFFFFNTEKSSLIYSSQICRRGALWEM